MFDDAEIRGRAEWRTLPRARLSIEDVPIVAGVASGKPSAGSLSAGVPMMMAPPTMTISASRAISDGCSTMRLKRINLEFIAYQRVGLNLAPVAPDYDPEPECCGDADTNGTTSAIRIDFIWRPKSFRRATKSRKQARRLQAASGLPLRSRDPAGSWSKSASRLLDRSGWTERRLTKPEDELVLEDFGLRCTLADLYRGTALQPRAKRLRAHPADAVR